MPEDNLQSLIQLIEAHDQRYSERLKSLQEMMNMALDAQKEIASRSETSFNIRLEAMNHFRDEFRTVMGTLATKKEVDAVFELIRATSSRLDIIDGRNKGLGIAWTLFIGGGGLIVGVLSTVMVISKGLF